MKSFLNAEDAIIAYFSFNRNYHFQSRTKHIARVALGTIPGRTLSLYCSLQGCGRPRLRTSNLRVRLFRAPSRMIGAGVAKNSSLHNANVAKKDEFYTQLVDIERELSHYKAHFRDKVVFCNCDDPYESNFFKYFALNFNHLGLKKLMATCYDGSSMVGDELAIEFENESTKRSPYKIVISEVSDVNQDGTIDLADVEWLLKNDKNVLTRLQGNGDFRSQECIDLLQEADIVVTNPPFSLFREYVAQLIEYKKQFLIIGNVNAITYKEIFPLIKENKLWIGLTIRSGDREFGVPDDYPLNTAGNRIDEDGKKYIRVKGVRWFTNLDFKQRYEDIVLYKPYSPEEYPKYDNYDAINVNKTVEIPFDYDGVMGVPITFLDKYNPEQFEILGITQRNDDPYKTKYYTVDEYKNANDLNARSVLIIDGKPKSMYARVLIRRKV